jgi:hypothetical protein
MLSRSNVPRLEAFIAHPDRTVQDFEYSVPDPDEEGGYRDMKNNPSDYGSDAQMSDLPGYINVGIVPTTASVIASDRSSTGRIVTFPNWVQVSPIIHAFCGVID